MEAPQQIIHCMITAQVWSVCPSVYRFLYIDIIPTNGLFSEYWKWKTAHSIFLQNVTSRKQSVQLSSWENSKPVLIRSLLKRSAFFVLPITESHFPPYKIFYAVRHEYYSLIDVGLLKTAVHKMGWCVFYLIFNSCVNPYLSSFNTNSVSRSALWRPLGIKRK